MTLPLSLIFENPIKRNIAHARIVGEVYCNKYPPPIGVPKTLFVKSSMITLEAQVNKAQNRYKAKHCVVEKAEPYFFKNAPIKYSTESHKVLNPQEVDAKS